MSNVTLIITKVSEQVRDTLCKISEHVTFAYVVTTIMPVVFAAKNPKNHESLIARLTGSMPEFGFAGIDVKFVLKYVKEALASINPGVRTAVYPLIAAVYMYVGPAFAGFFEQEKPAILEQINAEIEKVRCVLIEFLFADYTTMQHIQCRVFEV